MCDTALNCTSLCNCSHQFCKNIPVSFDFITTWNQWVFLCSLCIFWVSVCSLCCPACKMQAPYIIVIYVCPLWLYHYFIKNTIFKRKKKKKSMNINYVWIFSTALSEIFLILRRTEWDIMINLHRSPCKLSVKLVRLKWNLNFINRFWKHTKNINFRENPFVESRVVRWGQTDRWSDRHDETNSRFLQFCERAWWIRGISAKNFIFPFGLVAVINKFQWLAVWNVTQKWTLTL